MVVSRALKRSLAPKASTLPAVECLTPAEHDAPHKKFSVPLLPLLLLIFSGLVAARLLPEVSSGVSIAPSLTTDVFPRPASAHLDVSPQKDSERANFSEPAFRCQSWCLSRVAPISHVSSIEHCYSQCLAHPEVMGFIPALEASAAAPSGIDARNLLFAAWYAEGERGSEGHDNHQLPKPDTSFIATLRRSHPGCTIAVLTDQATQIELPEGVRLFRFTLDRSKLGRNAYANYYQYLAQIAFMQQLMMEGLGDSTDVVFLDMDVLVVDSIAEIFSQGAPFDYGVTLSDAVDMPINLGMQFVPRGRYPRAIAFLQDVLSIYPFNETFIAGQVALSNLVGINNDEPQVLTRVNESVVDGRSCKLVGGKHTVCFFPCMRYNYCHVDQSCCTDPNRLPVSLTTHDELTNARVKVLHFVGHRKKVLQLIHRAFMQGGAEGAYRMLSMLPHSEQEYAGLDVAALEQYLLEPIGAQ